MKALQEYDISPKTGFLPAEPPLRRLDDPYFAPWETVMDDFHGLLLATKLRKVVQQMPLLDYTRLKSVREYRRAFHVLCILSHGTIWGKMEKPLEVLPACLAIPWCGVATYLGLQPVACYASIVLWNYKLLNRDDRVELGNLATLTTYTGSMDESWFYLVSAAIESTGAPCLPAMMNSIQLVSNGDYTGLIQELQTIHTTMIEICELLQRMYEKCDPHVFYSQIRQFFSGWKNMAEAGLPHGIIYEGVDWMTDEASTETASSRPAKKQTFTDTNDRQPQYRQFSGASAAQSSFIAALDAFFGVDHSPMTTNSSPKVRNGSTETSPPSSTSNHSLYQSVNSSLSSFVQQKLSTPNTSDDELSTKYKSRTAGYHHQQLQQPSSPPLSPTPSTAKGTSTSFLRSMRDYMPGPHREFLGDLERAANLRSLILQLSDQQQASSQEILSDEEKMMIQLYNDCLAQLELFRDKHLQMVTVYIINQARKSANKKSSGYDSNSDTKPHFEPKKQDQNIQQEVISHSPVEKTRTQSTKVTRGSGGTNLLPFLRQSRDETVNSKIPVAVTSSNGMNGLCSSSNTSSSSDSSSNSESSTTTYASPMPLLRSWLDWLPLK